MDRYIALVADRLQRINQRREANPPFFPQGDLAKSYLAAAPRLKRIWTVGGQDVILQIHIE